MNNNRTKPGIIIIKKRSGLPAIEVSLQGSEESQLTISDVICVGGDFVEYQERCKNHSHFNQLKLEFRRNSIFVALPAYRQSELREEFNLQSCNL